MNHTRCCAFCFHRNLALQFLQFFLNHPPPGKDLQFGHFQIKAQRSRNIITTIEKTNDQKSTDNPNTFTFKIFPSPAGNAIKAKI